MEHRITMRQHPSYLISIILLFFTTAYASYFPNHTWYHVCFTPQENCTRELVTQIDKASQSIYLQSYSFTSKQIIYALIRAYKRGVIVKVILDRSQFDKKRRSKVYLLWRAHVPVWEDNTLSIAHNKIMIIDQNLVQTGSFNYTYSAQYRNAENILMIKDPALAKTYMQNWLLRQQHSIQQSSYDPSASRPRPIEPWPKAYNTKK